MFGYILVSQDKIKLSYEISSYIYILGMVHTLTCSIKLWINWGSWKSTEMFINVYSIFFLIGRLKLSCPMHEE